MGNSAEEVRVTNEDLEEMGADKRNLVSWNGWASDD